VQTAYFPLHCEPGTSDSIGSNLEPGTAPVSSHLRQ